MNKSENPKSHFFKIEIPDEEVFTHCIHCGMCLPVCPTYKLTGMERSSPRGRIRLIKSVAEDKLPISDIFVEEMDFCLDCQACQTVCPSGVKFGQLVEASRAQITSAGKEKNGLIKKFFFRFIFTSHFRLKFLARILRTYQNIFRNIFNKIGILKLLPNELQKIEPIAPKISDKFSDQILSEKMSPKHVPKYKVGFLKGCLMNVMFADINKDTVDVLLENDCEVYMPKEQVCCGSLAAHNGDFEIAKKLAIKNIDIFLEIDLDAIVINSAGCSAFMKEYGDLLNDNDDYREKAKLLSKKIKDINEFLIEINYKKSKYEVNKKVTYHDACHMAHSQKIISEPRQIIQSIPGIQFEELNEANWCCGSAGIYNIVRHDDSMNILDQKIKNILATEADILVAANPGCAVQIDYSLRKCGSNIQVMNPMTLLKMGYGIGD